MSLEAARSGGSDVCNRKGRLLKWSAITLGTIVTLLGLFLLGLKIYHPNFIYVPTHYGKGTEDMLLKDLNVAPERITITPLDKVNLRAYWLKSSTRIKGPTLLYLHGNSGDLEHTFSAVQGWQSSMSLNVLIPSYRGYGFSEGSPSMIGIQADAQAALDYLLKHPDVDPANIILYGHSLGGAVALHLAAANLDKFRAIVVENTFTNIKNMASKVVPYIAWATFVVTEVWDNEEQLKTIAKFASRKGQKVPNMLFISGAKDMVVPPEHMVKLWDLAQKIKQASPQIQLDRLHMAEGHHSCYGMNGYFSAISKFVEASGVKRLGQ